MKKVLEIGRGKSCDPEDDLGGSGGGEREKRNLSFILMLLNEPFVPDRGPLCFSTLSDYKCHFLITFIQLAVTYAHRIHKGD